MAVNASNIPSQLQALPQWVNWRWEKRPNKRTGELKWTKPPYQPNGRHASSTHLATWVSFDDALAAYHRGSFDGLGIVLTPKLGIAGADLDHCRDPESGEIKPWALSIVQRLDSYTEVTPSATGLRIFVKAKLPRSGRKRGNIEMYESERYLTVTGWHLEGTPATINERQSELTKVHQEIFSQRSQAPRRQWQAHATVDMDDEALLTKAKATKNGAAISRLWDGDIFGYPSQSEADLTLCSHLAFWTAGDADRMDNLLRASGLYRPKWNERHGALTYGQITINKALDGARAFYAGGGDHIQQPSPQPINGHTASSGQRPSGRVPGQLPSRPGESVGHVVRVIPALFPQAWGRGLMQPLRVWYLLRALHWDACGRLDKTEALDLLRGLGWSQASAYRLIREGMGTFWNGELSHPHGRHGVGRKTLVLVGAKALAVAWGLERLCRHQVEVPWELYAGGVAAWNALAYHACLPGPRPPRISRAGSVRKPLPNHPYSRAKIREDTGISERTQIRHQELLLPGTRRKVTPKRANYATHREELKSKRHSSWAQRRLGNSYTSNLWRRGWGQGKEFNKNQGGSRPHARDATGSSSTGRARRFFEKATDLRLAHQKDMPLYPDPMFRLTPSCRDGPTAMNRRTYLGWWKVLDIAGTVAA